MKWTDDVLLVMPWWDRVDDLVTELDTHGVTAHVTDYASRARQLASSAPIDQIIGVSTGFERFHSELDRIDTEEDLSFAEWFEQDVPSLTMTTTGEDDSNDAIAELIQRRDSLVADQCRATFVAPDGNCTIETDPGTAAVIDEDTVRIGAAADLPDWVGPGCDLVVSDRRDAVQTAFEVSDWRTHTGVSVKSTTTIEFYEVRSKTT